MRPGPAISSVDAKPGRLIFLDWLRILAFGLLVFYHVGMYYVSWDFHVKSPHAGHAIEPLMRLTNPWRMDLLFLVSGAATSFMLLRDGTSGRWLQLRAGRLLIPLLFGILVVVPPQSWLEVAQKYHYAGGYANFWGLYLAHFQGFCDAAGQCLILPSWNHLWFLPYLFLYTLLLWLVLRRCSLSGCREVFSRRRARHDRTGRGNRRASSAQGSSLPTAVGVADQTLAQHALYAK